MITRADPFCEDARRSPVFISPELGGLSPQIGKVANVGRLDA